VIRIVLVVKDLDLKGQTKVHDPFKRPYCGVNMGREGSWGPVGYQGFLASGPGMPRTSGAFNGYQGPPWAYPGHGWYSMAFPHMMGPAGMVCGRGAGDGGRRGGGMMHPRRMMRIQRLLNQLDNSDMSDDDQKKDPDDNVQTGKRSRATSSTHERGTATYEE